ncbi:hypothetical protein PUV47_06785 [Pseudovibrio exalbescens]|uniref:capsular polysaccharide export protein, LipB/KpsS family n=1 Tax=Pseudovibrio exalbescens TaxID=197461 RepID=UPI002366BFB5|nr:hypothetical protein [Pseudovibrio exalbescens]MDD7909619.1 hypothetical protein [Pseudovibrio exalbescens]
MPREPASSTEIIQTLGLAVLLSTPHLISGSLALFSSGMLSHRREIEHLSGLEVRFYKEGQRLSKDTVAIGGWGYKDSANHARIRSKVDGLPYWAFEDGFLRAVAPGIAEPSSCMLIDRGGIFYNATSESHLFELIRQAKLAADKLDDVQSAMAHLKQKRISKYNNFDPSYLPEKLKAVPDGSSILIIDQTAGDASIPGALASADSFKEMISFALASTDSQSILIKTHPDVMAGLKEGFIGTGWTDARLIWVTEPVSPWLLFEKAETVFTVSSQLGMEALIAGCAVQCWGMPFYAGWGVTTDHIAAPEDRRLAKSIPEIFSASYLQYSTYFDHWNRQQISIHEAIDQLDYLRRCYLEKPRTTFGFLPRKPKQWVYKTLQRPPRPSAKP